MLYHVVAMAENRVIGRENRLPWHFSSDLKHFKALTTGSTLLMGRKTFASLGGKPLPNRHNFVLSRSAAPPPVGTLRFFGSLATALAAVLTEHCYIIGGADLFRQTIDRVDGIYLTLIHASYDGDVYYPEIPSSFREKTRHTLQDHPKLEVIFYEKAPMQQIFRSATPQLT